MKCLIRYTNSNTLPHEPHAQPGMTYRPEDAPLDVPHPKYNYTEHVALVGELVELKGWPTPAMRYGHRYQKDINGEEVPFGMAGMFGCTATGKLALVECA